MKPTFFSLFFMFIFLPNLFSQSEIQMLYEKKEYEAILKQVEKKDTTIKYSAQDLYFIARSYQRGNYNEAAILYFDKALMAGNDSVNTHFFKGVSLLEENNFLKAIPCFTAAIKLDSTNEDCWTYRGNCYLYTQNIDSAITDFSKAITFETEGSSAPFLLMYAYFAKDDFKNSEATYTKYQKEIMESDYKLSAQNILGKIERDVKHNYKKAISYFEKVLQSDSLDLKIYEDMLITYTKMEKWDKVDDLFAQLLEKHKTKKLYEKYHKRTAAIVEKFLFKDTLEVTVLRYFKKPEQFAEPIYQAYINHVVTDSTLFMVKTEKSFALSDKEEPHMICAWVGVGSHYNYGMITKNGKISYAIFKNRLIDILNKRIKPVAATSSSNRD